MFRQHGTGLNIWHGQMSLMLGLRDGDKTLSQHKMANAGYPENANVNSDVICYIAISGRVTFVLCTSV